MFWIVITLTGTGKTRKRKNGNGIAEKRVKGGKAEKKVKGGINNVAKSLKELVFDPPE